MRVHYLLPRDVAARRQRRRALPPVAAADGDEVRFDLAAHPTTEDFTVLPARLVRLIASGSEAVRLAQYVWWGGSPEDGEYVRVDDRRNLSARVQWHEGGGLSAVIQPRTGTLLGEEQVRAIVGEAWRAARTGADLPDPITQLTKRDATSSCDT